MQLKPKSVMSLKDRGELDKRREEKSKEVASNPVFFTIILWFLFYFVKELQ